MDYKIETMLYDEKDGNIGFLLIDTNSEKYIWIDIKYNQMKRIDGGIPSFEYPWLTIKELIVFKFKNRLYRLIKITSGNIFYLQVVSVSKDKDTNMLITEKEFIEYFAEFNSYYIDNKDEKGVEFICLRIPDVQQFVFPSEIIKNNKLTKIILDKKSVYTHGLETQNEIINGE